MNRTERPVSTMCITDAHQLSLMEFKDAQVNQKSEAGKPRRLELCKAFLLEIRMRALHDSVIA